MGTVDVNELIQFLTPDSRLDLKSTSCMSVAQLTGTQDGLELLSKSPKLLVALVNLIHDPEIYASKDAMRTFTNISAEVSGASSLISLTEINFINEIVKCIYDKKYVHADFACGILANISRPKHLCQQVLDRINDGSIKLEGLVFVLCQINYNIVGAKLHLLAPVITNFTQLSEGRKQIMDKSKCIFQRLLPFTEYKESLGRRHSIIAAIHNCCFEKENHLWLLSDEIDIISRLLLPLAGPDAFSPEDNDSLPLDLQYLPDTKEREPDSELRKLLLEAIMQLCVTIKCREILRTKNVYLILREHHKWETDKLCIMLNEDIVNLLICTEEEIGAEDLSAINITPEMAKKFASMDAEYLAEWPSTLDTENVAIQNDKSI